MNTYQTIECVVGRGAEIAADERAPVKPLKSSRRVLAHQLTVTLRKPGAYVFIRAGRWHIYDGARSYGGSRLFDEAVHRIRRKLISVTPGKLTLA